MILSKHSKSLIYYLNTFIDTPHPAMRRRENDQEECLLWGMVALVMRVSRVFGLAPLTFTRTREGWRVKVSHGTALYSYLLMFTLRKNPIFKGQVFLVYFVRFYHRYSLKTIFEWCFVSFLMKRQFLISTILLLRKKKKRTAKVGQI